MALPQAEHVQDACPDVTLQQREDPGTDRLVHGSPPAATDTKKQRASACGEEVRRPACRGVLAVLCCHSVSASPSLAPLNTRTVDMSFVALTMAMVGMLRLYASLMATAFQRKKQAQIGPLTRDCDASNELLAL